MLLFAGVSTTPTHDAPTHEMAKEYLAGRVSAPAFATIPFVWFVDGAG